MKTCLFWQLATRRTIYTRFSASCSTNIELFNGICYIGAFSILSLLRCGKNDLESCTFTPQNGGKSYPGRDVKTH